MSLGRTAITAVSAFRMRFSLRNVALACALLAASFLLTNATQDANANGETRSLTLHHAHTNENITVTYKRDGSFDPAALEKLNWFLRDWRVDEPISMAPQLFDVLWYVYREVGASEPIKVMSAYRSPGTNAMLRRRSRAVAKESQHMRGNAMDVHFPGVSIGKVREIGMRLQRGGVGYYPSAGSPFVHLDIGSVRSWPRMPRDQLERLFPDGKTVHIPKDGIPLANYELALAEVQAQGGSALDYATVNANRGKSLWALLFGGDEDEDSNQPAARGRNTRVADARRRGAPEPVTPISGGDSVSSWGTAAIAPRTDRPASVAAIAPPTPPASAGQPDTSTSGPATPEKREQTLLIASLPMPPIRPRGTQLERLLAASEPMPPIRPGNLGTLIASLPTPAAPPPPAVAAVAEPVTPAPVVVANVPAPPVRPAAAAVVVAVAPVPVPDPSAVDLPLPPLRRVAPVAVETEKLQTSLPGILSRAGEQPPDGALTQAYAAISAPLPPNRPSSAVPRGVASGASVPIAASSSAPAALAPQPLAAPTTRLAAAMATRPEAQTRPARVAAVTSPPVVREVKSQVIAMKFSAPTAVRTTGSGAFGGSFIRPMGASFTRAGE